MSTKNSLVDPQVNLAFQKLAESAAALNAASDQLSKPIADLDAAIKNLNLGVSCWVRIGSWGDEDSSWEGVNQLGYQKIAGRWGIAVSTYTTDGGEPENRESWLLGEAPRQLRLKALDHIPELLEALVKETEKTTKQIQSKVAQARELAAALTARGR